MDLSRVWKWNLLAVIAGLAALTSLPDITRLGWATQIFSSSYVDSFLVVIYSRPPAALISFAGLVVVVIGAVRRNPRLLVPGLLVSASFFLHQIISWVIVGVGLGVWTLFPIVSLISFGFPEYDSLISVIGEIHFHLFPVFLAAQAGLIVNLKKLPPSASADSANLEIDISERSSAMPEVGGYCQSCGEKAISEKSFCANCGQELSAGTTVRATYSAGKPPPAALATTGIYNTLAIIAFVVSWFVPIVGFFLAYPARNEIHASGGAQKGLGFVTGALVLNWIWVVALVLIIFGSALLV